MSAPTDKTIVLFDGICNFCNATINLLIDHDPKSRLRFASLQSNTGQRLLAEHSLPVDWLESIVVLDANQVLTRSSGMLRIATRLGWPWKALGVFWIVPRPLRDAVYGFIAKHRYRWFGQSDSCRVPTPELRERFLI